jgi:aflatoxin B1 aldehyde reductase
MYNAITREVERELLPCLRALGMRFYGYNPLAGGLLTGKHSAQSVQTLTEGRFRIGNELYRSRYLHPAQLQASEAFLSACADAGIPPARAALRWLRHHSALRSEAGDGVIVGASKSAHLEDNLAGLADEEPLPESVLAAIDRGWELVRSAGCVPSYERGTSKY